MIKPLNMIHVSIIEEIYNDRINFTAGIISQTD